MGPVSRVFCHGHGTTWIASYGTTRRASPEGSWMARWIVASGLSTRRPAGVGFREVSVVEIKDVLRGWRGGAGLGVVAERAGVDRQPARRYVTAAQEAGLERSAGFEAVDDEL